MDRPDTLWLLPLFLSALMLLATARAWWVVANGKRWRDHQFKPTDADLRRAAEFTALAFALVGISLLALFLVRL